MAREQKGCQVVDMDWLLKSIEKKTPESVQKYLLVKKKGKKDTEAKTKKRMRETLPEDEANDPKKTKNEQQIIHKYLADLVDERYPNPRQ